MNLKFKKVKKILKQYLKTDFSFFYPWLLFIGYVLILGFIFYNLLIVERSSQDISKPIGMSLWIIYICLFFTNLFIFLFLLNRLHKKKKVNPFFYRLMFNIVFVIEKLYENIATSYLILIHYNNNICARYDEFLYLNFTWFYYLNQKTRQWFFALILVIPKGLVLLSLIYDVFFVKEIHYFYSSLGLLIIPFLIRFCKFIYKKSYEIQSDLFHELTEQCSVSDEDMKILLSFWNKADLPLTKKLLLGIKKISAIFFSIIFYPKDNYYSLMSKYIGYTYFMYPIIQELEEEEKKINFKLNLLIRGAYAIIFAYIVIITKSI